MEVGLLEPQCLLLEIDRSVEADGGQLLGEEGVVRMLLDEVAQLLVLYLVGAFHHLLDAAELVDELLGGLLPHPRDAGDIVGGVAPEAEEVDDLTGIADAEFLLHLGDAHDGVGASHAAEAVHLNMLGDELGEVLVGRHHDDLVEARELGLVAEGADDVVGLIAFAGEDGDAEIADDALHPRQAHLYLFRHRLAVSLVFGVHLMTEGRLLQIESYADMCGALAAQQVIERGGETQHARGVEALGVDAGNLIQRIVGAVHRRHAINK